MAWPGEAGLGKEEEARTHSRPGRSWRGRRQQLLSPREQKAEAADPLEQKWDHRRKQELGRTEKYSVFAS